MLVTVNSTSVACTSSGANVILDERAVSSTDAFSTLPINQSRLNNSLPVLFGAGKEKKGSFNNSSSRT